MEDRALENQVAIRLEPADLTVAPGSSVTVPLSAQNLSASDGAFELAVRGIPSVWVSVPAPVLRVGAGEQHQVSLTIQPPSDLLVRAGRHPVVIPVANQEAPQQATEANDELAAEGIALVAEGAAEMGAAEALHVRAEMVEEVAE